MTFHGKNVACTPATRRLYFETNTKRFAPYSWTNLLKTKKTRVYKYAVHTFLNAPGLWNFFKQMLEGLAYLSINVFL